MPYALLVDDDQSFAESLAAAVAAGHEFTTRTAGSLREAREAIAHTMPDVLLVDVNLPDGSGLELLGDVAGSPTTEVVLITGQASVESAVEALRRGATDYLTKPVDLERLRKVLTAVTQTRELKLLTGNLPWGPERRRPYAEEAAPPLRFGRYEVRDEIGQGAMGRVYRAFDPLVGRVVAIKTVRSEHLTTSTRDDYLRRFRREAQAAGTLAHSNVVRVFDVGDDYLVMEYIEGVTLEQLLRHHRVLDRGTALRILAPLAEALDYAHRAGVIHRDIKPSNVMVQPDGRPKLMDFGVARLDASESSEGAHVFGSPSYMAPEQITGGELTTRTDLYALAVVAYELLTGSRPFRGDGIASVFYQVVHKAAEPASSLNPALSLTDDEVLGRALSKRPEERFATAWELVTHLATAQAEISPAPLLHAILAAGPTDGGAAAQVPQVPPVSVARERGRWTQGRGWWIAAAVLLGLVLPAFHFLPPPSSRDPSAAAGDAAAVPVPPLLAILPIETDPPAARVRIDGQDVGRSPLSLRRVALGRHDIQVVADGHAPALVGIEVTEAGLMAPLRFVLTPLDGLLTVIAEPDGALVTIDGRLRGRAPLAGVRVAPGRHDVRLEATGYGAQTTVVESRGGETRLVRVQLTRMGTASPPAPATEARREPGAPTPPPAPPRAAVFDIAGDIVPPRLIHGPPAHYPEVARRQRLFGLVRVEVIVNERGEPEDLQIVQSAGSILDRAVLDAVRGFRFQPATRDGVKVRVRWPYNHRFAP